MIDKALLESIYATNLSHTRSPSLPTDPEFTHEELGKCSGRRGSGRGSVLSLEGFREQFWQERHVSGEGAMMPSLCPAEERGALRIRAPQSLCMVVS